MTGGDVADGGIGPGRRYRLISGDSHVNEPPELFVSRVP